MAVAADSRGIFALCCVYMIGEGVRRCIAFQSCRCPAVSLPDDQRIESAFTRSDNSVFLTTRYCKLNTRVTFGAPAPPAAIGY